MVQAGAQRQDEEIFTSLTSAKILTFILGIFGIAFVAWPTGGHISSLAPKQLSTLYTNEQADLSQSALGSIISQLNTIQEQLNNATQRRYDWGEQLMERSSQQGSSQKASDGAEEFPTIWVCTMVNDEAPYIVEWINHLASQGVSSFMIFDDRSTDNIRYLPAFYQTHHPEVDVRVFKHEYERGQEQAWEQCREMALGRKARWVIVCDVDEFWWSPTYATIKEFIKHVEAQEPEITAIDLNQARFGAGAITERYQNELVLDMDKAKEGCQEPTWSDPDDMTDGPIPASANLCPVKLINPAGIQLIIENLVRRSPSLLLDEPTAVAALERQFSVSCAEEWTCAPRIDHKGMWRVDACASVFTHQCRTLTRGREIKATPLEMRSNHFYVRTKADAYLHAQKWDKTDPVNFFEKANDFHTSILDTSLRTLSGLLVRKQFEAYLAE